MGRGEEQSALSELGPELRSRQSSAAERLAALYEWAPSPRDHSSEILTAHHPKAPPDVNPLEGLHDEIKSFPVELQMETLIRSYGGWVGASYGLSLALLESHDSPQEQQLRQLAERGLAKRIAYGMSADEAVQDLWQLTQAREAELCWACDELGLSREWVIEVIRAGLRERAINPRLPLKIDLQREAELTERHGVVDRELVDVLSDLPAGSEEMSEEEKLEELTSAYGSLIYDQIALKDYDMGLESPAAWQLSAQLSERARSSDLSQSEELEAVRLDLRSREAQAVWAIRALDLPASGVLRELESEARSKLAQL